MKGLIATRLMQLVAVILIVGTLSFALMYFLPGDPALRIAAGRYGPDMMDNAISDMVRAELGLDQPILVRFLSWMGDLVRFDLGHSLVTGAPVIHEIGLQLGYTLWLAVTAFVLSLVIGPVAGAIAGLFPGSVYDRVMLLVAVGLRAVPPFVLAILFMMVFGVTLRWLPTAGFGGWENLVLPSFTLALGLAAMSSRVMRDAMMGVASAPYFIHARYKGLSDRAVVMRHGVRNASLPVVTYLGLQMVYLVEGVVVVESIFAFPGIGHALVHAIIARDVPMVQGTALAMGGLFVLLNSVVDLMCLRLDPRLRRAA
ncbi:MULTISPECIES: ABC transporter permease [Thalassospira]|jgi:peptide/nickel transport system permease protein|uniref:ABC transporter permease n=1 Tax=Thalassospira xiamenensis TaxID=220697 RepID=A0A367X3J1_9PROT|nr:MULTISPECIES: ABC transporter permease [Thalassospira]KZB51393.1 ABC transporter permease [Thalassospira xiamenensis]MAB33796.1 ABC transporter permease [Thalassospira sp.]MCH2277217.1 ABC transporter permease [Thalassospira sp.]MCK2166382.1 ABC transporter permease [Thalassospira xiamenensis]MDM7977105.1 ABC transporter permease [Thalassospira xiamenensis]